jgi:hypothetical protein
MALIKTVNGLIAWDPLDEIDGWQSYPSTQNYPPPEPYPALDYQFVFYPDAPNGWTGTQTDPQPSLYQANNGLSINMFLFKAFDVGSGSTRRIRVWSCTGPAWAQANIQVGSQSYTLAVPTNNGLPPSWLLNNNGSIPTSITGIAQVQLWSIFGGSSYGVPKFANLVISGSDLVTIAGLQPNQAVIIYRTRDNGVLGLGIVAGGVTPVTIGGSTSTTSQFYDEVYAFPIVPTQSGTISSIGVQVSAPAGSLQLALYADSGGPSGTPLAVTSVQVCTGGWCDIPTSVSVVGGSTYWVVVQQSSSSCALYAEYESIQYYYQTAGFGTWPYTNWSTATGSQYVPNIRISYASANNSCAISIANENYPELCYAVIYATDHQTILEETPSYLMCGGDTWTWGPSPQFLTLLPDDFIFYTQTAVADPKTVNITVTLLTPGGAPYPNATLYFTTSQGVLNTASSVTNAAGQTTVQLTSAAVGVCVVSCTWLGDSNVPPATGYAEVHCFLDAEAGDSTQKFQVFVEGVQYAPSSGTYTRIQGTQIGQVTMELPRWDPRLAEGQLIHIYRWGVLDYAGCYYTTHRTLSSRVVQLSGPHVTALLARRVVDQAVFTAEYPQNIFTFLLANFPTGITAGDIGNYTDQSFSEIFDTVSVQAIIQQILIDCGWLVRVNDDLTLDFASHFGVAGAATFTEGGNILDIDYVNDLSSVQNVEHIRGAAIARSVQGDPVSLGKYGLFEGAILESKISDQSTLDLIGQTFVAQNSAANIQIQVIAKDTYPPGTFNVGDFVTIVSPTLGLNELHEIVEIDRDLTNPNLVTIKLDTAGKEWWQLSDDQQRILVDLATI